MIFISILVSLALVATIIFLLWRFSITQRQLAESIDQSHTRAFHNAMEAFANLQERIVQSQTDMFNRTVDMLAGPQQSPPTGEYATDQPKLDNRVVWQPDDEFDYSGIGLDPTDETLPDPPIEPESNEHRAVMLPPGEGLLPH